MEERQEKTVEERQEKAVEERQEKAGRESPEVKVTAQDNTESKRQVNACHSIPCSNFDRIASPKTIF